MADIDGNSNVDKMMEFKPTMELRQLATREWLPALNRWEQVLQQKWVNELGDEEWRGIPLVISE
jgi:hypothetical protein